MRLRVILIAAAVMAAALSAQAQQCDPALQSHVYHPKRLKIIKPCVTYTGTIMKAKKELDADYHLQIKPDVADPAFVNARNRARQHGYTVAEVICTARPKQKDAIIPCGNFRSSTPPKAGSHVRVTGPLVLDTEPGHKWVEAGHPAVVEIIP